MTLRNIRSCAEAGGSKVVIERGTQYGGTKEGNAGFSAFVVPSGHQFDRELHWVAWFQGLPMSSLESLRCDSTDS